MDAGHYNTVATRAVRYLGWERGGKFHSNRASSLLPCRFEFSGSVIIFLNGGACICLETVYSPEAVDGHTFKLFADAVTCLECGS